MSDHRTRRLGPYKAVYQKEGFWHVTLNGSHLGGFTPLAGRPSDAFIKLIEDFEEQIGRSYLPRKRVPITPDMWEASYDYMLEERGCLPRAPNGMVSYKEVIDCVLEVEGDQP
jgi:hypothetical protein